MFRRAALSAVALSLLAAGVALAEPVTEADPAKYDYGKQTLRVGVWVDRDDDEVYRKGDPLTVGLQANSDAYAVVYRIDTEGRVEILWPRSRMDDGFVFGGHEYELPVSGAARIRVSGEPGMGYVEAIASSYPFDLRDLEIDFHHEMRDESYDFYVAGDPFLAMNEINYAVTGLEDAADYIVTDYAGYYVHEKVDHPRYLCNQCHVDEDVHYDPYDDHCSLTIQVDYGWSNHWYRDYGYYPIYWHPTYVYYDPWTWRPWVNYWYYPAYHWPVYPRYTWGYSAYYWYDSPYYFGDVYYYRTQGHHKYRPLGHVYDGDPRTKKREYVRPSPFVKNRLVDDDLRVAMKTRTPLGGRSAKDLVRGERPVVRQRPDLGGDRESRGRPGLRVRDNVRDGLKVRPSIRHTAGSSKKRPALTPVSGKRPDPGSQRPVVRDERKPGAVRGERPVPDRTGGLKRDSKNDGRGTIKPVEPRKKGTRVWNRGTYDKDSGRKNDADDSRGTVRDSRSGDSKRSGDKTVRPKPSRKSEKRTPEVRSKTGDRSKGSGSGDRGSSSPRVRSGGTGKSSGGSSPATPRGSGGSRSKSSGGSRGSAKDSRGG